MNGKLKEIMAMESVDDDEFLEEFKRSMLIVPLTDDFDIVPLKSNNSVIAPFFTDEDELALIPELKNFKTAAMLPIHAQELIIKRGDVDEVVIDPKSPHSIGMTFDTFTDIFRKETLEGIEEIIRTHGSRLKEDTRFYLREREPFMKNDAENGIFTSDIPFLASYADDGDENRKCLNILNVSRGTTFLRISDDGLANDTIFEAPIRFKLIEENGNIFTWQSISDDAKYKEKHIVLIHLLVAIFIIALVLFILF